MGKFLINLMIFISIFGLTGILFGQTQQNIEFFGKKVENVKNTYDYNKDYAVRFEINKAGKIFAIEVIPKYYLQELNSEWEEPNYNVGLDQSEFEIILSKINKLENIGNLSVEGSIGIVTNNKTTFRDIYENAVVERRMNDTGFSPNSKKSFRSFVVYFKYSIQGKVENISKTKTKSDIFLKQIKVRNCLYLTIDNQIEKGVLENLEVFGPINSINTGCQDKD